MSNVDFQLFEVSALVYIGRFLELCLEALYTFDYGTEPRRAEIVS